MFWLSTLGQLRREQWKGGYVSAEVYSRRYSSHRHLHFNRRLCPRKAHRIQESIFMMRFGHRDSPGVETHLCQGLQGHYSQAGGPHLSHFLVLLTTASIFPEEHLVKSHSQITQVQQSLSHRPRPYPIDTAIPWLGAEFGERGNALWEELGWVEAMLPNGSQTTWICCALD